ncbi:MAG TPA: MtnX-like HAD-IB family phosphatase [Syntrophales bacterium]|nr:MtnX-like HAD-IB family phosphatase [Syntrophales bacterium]
MKNKVTSRRKDKTLAICDFDGTVSTVDIGHEVLKKYSGDKWDDIDAAYCSGRIGSMEAYRLIASIVRIPRKDLEAYLSGLNSIDPYFEEFHRICRSRSIDIAIISDGLDFYIEDFLRRHGFPDLKFYSNKVVFTGRDRINIEFPRFNEQCGKCGTCKRMLLESMRKDYSRIIYIGDGYSDICPARQADLVFGKDILFRSCVKAGKECIYYRDFRRIIEEIRDREGSGPAEN